MSTRYILHFATAILASVLAWSTAAGGESDDCAQVLAKLPECKCEHILCLAHDAVNATTLRDRFAREAENLGKLYPNAATDGQQANASKDAYGQFVSTVGSDLPPAPGYTGPTVIPYESVGGYAYVRGSTGAVASLQKMPVKDQCARTAASKAKLCEAVQKSVCRGMAEAIVAHENYHVEQCVALGGAVNYLNRTQAQIATEEAQAYQRQDDVLTKAEEKARESCPCDPLKPSSFRNRKCWGSDAEGSKGRKSPCTQK
jgi:hypothetical protein